MKVIMVMFDSLNRRMLPPYGCDWTHMPNFTRLAQHAATFDRAYVGSMPCMPARRELHTGRYNFLHRSWGPLEPFDDSMPELLARHGVHTHLVTDHYHYWEEGGATYHTRFSSHETVRGQEGDKWMADLTDGPAMPDSRNNDHGSKAWMRQDWVNRHYMREEKDQPQPQTFARGIKFIETNHAVDNWFLQLETFDPHEPYFSNQKYKDLYPHQYTGKHFDWPPYAPVSEDRETVEHLRCESAALHSMCDAYLGRVLDVMDRLSLWKDTMLIVNTDHGFLLGEHEWWAKCAMPFYDEVAHMPLFIWDPRCSAAGVRRQALVQTIDLPATILDFFGAPVPPDMQGVPLRATIAADTPVRAAALFGIHGGHINVTDGRYVYMRAPATADNQPLFEYTLMPTHMRHTFAVDELQTIELSVPFPFTKGCKTMKIPTRHNWAKAHAFGTLLFDLEMDPKQENPLNDERIEQTMIAHLDRLMKATNAPAEQYTRLGLA